MSTRLPRGAWWWGTAKYVPRDEAVRAAFRPSAWFILLHAPGAMVSILLLIGASAAWAMIGPGAREIGWLLVRIGVLAFVLNVLVGIARWFSRLYVVTDRRVIVVAGVLSQSAADVPLQRVQHATVSKSLIERVLGLGTVGIATAGADGSAVRLLMVRRPESVVEMVRVGGPRRHEGIVVIGLAGGIGAGKSEVARHLGEMGCVVIDSDAESRAALDRPEIRERLVEWWGPGVIDAEGKVVRSRIAEIIFNDDAERKRLEGLVHPLVRTRRAEAIARARAVGARAAVIDAPLLFEAGVDAECDTVVWVEASHAVRLKRVRERRGWDESELRRREAAQWPIERKRALCRYEITNEGAEGDLRSSVGAVLERVLAERPVAR